MKLILKQLTAAVLINLWLLPAFAEADSKSGVDPAVSKIILERLTAARPELTYTTVEASPVPGIFQVRIEQGPILYVTEDGGFFFVGDLFEVQADKFVNLAEQAMNELRRAELAKLDVNTMIVFPAIGETKAVVNVFTDVDCGYCRKLHKEMAEFNEEGIEIRYLAFPRAGLNSPSFRKIATAWCAATPEERRQALTRMKNGEVLPENVCDDNPVAAQYQLGNLMGVNGTPALVLMDGTLLPGYRTAPVLARILGIN